ncbi:NAD(P)H-hydrate epimerase [Anaerolineae bacterium CFX8]|nr:NAD(P)H-hydrate epimerase [Anaerolineae bacterium CFX8]
MITYPTLDVPVPYLTTVQMREVDRAMVEDFHIDLIQMMENAGRSLARLARDRFLDGDPRGKTVIVLAGTGGNGGGGLVCARHLHNAGADVRVYTTAADERLTSVPKHQMQILRAMDIFVGTVEDIARQEKNELVIDAIIGYSLRGAPEGASAKLIEWANACGSPILALDVPSGVDAAVGTVFEPAIRADATMTLALPKVGLRVGAARDHIGELYLADISVPPALYAMPSLGLNVPPLFAHSDILRLD